MRRVETCESLFWTRIDSEPRKITELSELMAPMLEEGWEPWGTSECSGGPPEERRYGYIVFFKRPVERRSLAEILENIGQGIYPQDNQSTEARVFIAIAHALFQTSEWLKAAPKNGE